MTCNYDTNIYEYCINAKHFIEYGNIYFVAYSKQTNTLKLLKNQNLPSNDKVRVQSI